MGYQTRVISIWNSLSLILDICISMEPGRHKRMHSPIFAPTVHKPQPTV